MHALGGALTMQREARVRSRVPIAIHSLHCAACVFVVILITALMKRKLRKENFTENDNFDIVTLPRPRRCGFR